MSFLDYIPNINNPLLGGESNYISQETKDRIIAKQQGKDVDYIKTEREMNMNTQNIALEKAKKLETQNKYQNYEYDKTRKNYMKDFIVAQKAGKEEEYRNSHPTESKIIDLKTRQSFLGVASPTEISEYETITGMQSKDSASQDTRLRPITPIAQKLLVNPMNAFNNEIIGKPNPITGAPGTNPMGAPGVPGTGTGVAPQKNLTNQYTFNNGHKEFDSSAIPGVLNKGNIKPSTYFTQNGLSWTKDAPRIAKEMGLENYRGTPGENYKLVQYMAAKKNGTATGEATATTDTVDTGRKFDGIGTQGLYRNRFSAEDQQKVSAMDEDTRNKYLSERDVTDLKAYLTKNSGNLALINKVLGTNYTSDDLTGGPGRVRNLGSGLVNEMPTQSGIDITNRIAKLNHGDAKKWMNFNGELDNASSDDTMIKSNSGGIQIERGKILKDIVDGKRTKDGTSIDQNDQIYMDKYRDWKLDNLAVTEYNAVVGKFNAVGKNNIVKPKILLEIRQYVDRIKRENPGFYSRFKSEIDKVPGIVQSGGKISSLNQKDIDAVASGTTPQGGAPAQVDLGTAQTYNNVGTTTTPAGGNTTNPQGDSNVPWVPVATPETEVAKQTGEAKILKDPVNVPEKSRYSSYSREEPDGKFGYSEGVISKG